MMRRSQPQADQGGKQARLNEEQGPGPCPIEGFLGRAGTSCPRECQSLPQPMRAVVKLGFESRTPIALPYVSCSHGEAVRPRPSHPPLILKTLIWTPHKDARKERPAYPALLGIRGSPVCECGG